MSRDRVTSWLELAAVVLLASGIGVVVAAVIGGLLGMGVGMAAVAVVLGGASGVLSWLDQAESRRRR